MSKLFHKIVSYILRDRIQKYCLWESYEIGFSGVGTTALDIKPPFEKPKLPAFIERKIKEESAIVAKIRREAFRQSCIENLGEDPNEWGMY